MTETTTERRPRRTARELAEQRVETARRKLERQEDRVASLRNQLTAEEAELAPLRDALDYAQRHPALAEQTTVEQQIEETEQA